MALHDHSRGLSLEEWRQERHISKSPARGGRMTPMGSTAIGRPGNLPSRLDPGNRSGLPTSYGGNSQYLDARPQGNPDPWIDDVDLNGNWYSPFQPVWPFGPPYSEFPREWDYPVGYNLNYIQPRMNLMQMLRGMRSSWGVLAAVVATRQDQLLRIPFTFQRRDNPKAKSVGVEEMKKFFKRPDGQNSYSQWTRKLTDDLLVIDAPCIYFHKDRAGKPLAAQVMDGATIFPLIDDAGRRPSSVVDLTEDGLVYIRRQPAFQQIIKGMPLVNMDESELMYVPMRPRPEFPIFGYAPTEQILVQAMGAIRKMFYQTEYWNENTIPELIVTVPDNWSPRNIAAFQGHMDALLSGNNRLKPKMRFLPGGMKPFEIRGADGQNIWSEWDETMIRLVCYAYSVSPAPFIKMLNRSTAQNAQEMAEQEGLYPLMSFWKDDIIDPIIQNQFGYEDVEFVFQPMPEPDQEKAAKIHDMKLKNGQLSLNEARAEDGLEPIEGGDVHTITIGNAVIPVEEAADGKAMPMQANMFGQDAGPGGPSAGGVQGAKTPKPKPGKAQPPSTRNTSPLRGANRPRTESPAAKALGEQIADLLLKASREEIDLAARDAMGHLDSGATDGQHNVGNYRKGHVWVQGLDVSIENAKGTMRGKKRKDGSLKWQVKMPAHYGYIRKTTGADDDHVDAYIGPHPDSDRVYVVDQHRVSKRGKDRGFDEHKVMLGYKTHKKAIKHYMKSHSDGLGSGRMKAMTELTMKEFKAWLRDGDTTVPISGQKVGRRLEKADTISTSTNLAGRASLALNSDSLVPRKKRKTKKVRAGARWTLGAHA